MLDDPVQICFLKLDSDSTYLSEAFYFNADVMCLK